MDISSLPKFLESMKSIDQNLLITRPCVIETNALVVELVCKLMKAYQDMAINNAA